jgi:hypothetical protein
MPTGHEVHVACVEVCPKKCLDTIPTVTKEHDIFRQPPRPPKPVQPEVPQLPA